MLVSNLEFSEVYPYTMRETYVCHPFGENPAHGFLDLDLGFPKIVSTGLDTIFERHEIAQNPVVSQQILVFSRSHRFLMNRERVGFGGGWNNLLLSGKKGLSGIIVRIEVFGFGGGKIGERQPFVRIEGRRGAVTATGG